MKSKTDKSNTVEDIKKTTEDILEKLKIIATVEVSEEKTHTDTSTEEETSYKVNIQTTETGLIIGYHGETLNGLQLLLGVIIYKNLGKWVHIVVDVGNYRKMREESIKEMVNRIVAEVESTKQPVVLPYLSPLERRIVHVMLSGHKTIVSESAGEGRNRLLTIKPR